MPDAAGMSASAMSAAQLMGVDESHLQVLPCGHRLRSEVVSAFAELKRDAAQAGFELAIASSFRSFARQSQIFNGKASGQRPVHDDRGQPVAMADLDPEQQLHAILRYSALPGASRHHWGTDLDVYDAAAVAADYQVQLTPEEVADDGVFGALHRWLDGRIAAGESHGFYRPYAEDRGGVAPERWHLSYAPLALDCEKRWNQALLLACWDRELGAEGLLLRETIERHLPELVARYVSVTPGWCPA